jgi:hypothetical protein
VAGLQFGDAPQGRVLRRLAALGELAMTAFMATTATSTMSSSGSRVVMR